MRLLKQKAELGCEHVRFPGQPAMRDALPALDLAILDPPLQTFCTLCTHWVHKGPNVADHPLRGSRSDSICVTPGMRGGVEALEVLSSAQTLPLVQAFTKHRLVFPIQ